jgi:hypothetical protein
MRRADGEDGVPVALGVGSQPPISFTKLSYLYNVSLPSVDGDNEGEMNMLRKALLQAAFAVAVTVSFAAFTANTAQAFNFGVIQSGR